MFPIRCYTCNSVIGQKHTRYDRMLSDGMHPKKALESLRISNMCCRRMFLGHTNLFDEQIRFGNVDIAIDGGETVIERHVTFERTVSCD